MLVPDAGAACLDARGNPLEPTPLTPAMAPVPEDMDTTSVPASMRRSIEGNESEAKRLRTSTSSMPPTPSLSRRTSLTTPFPQAEALARQISVRTQASAAMQPVPEHNWEEKPAAAEVRNDAAAPAPEGNEATDENLNVTTHETLVINARAFCRICGSLEKEIFAGQVHCRRCLNDSFTDRKDQIYRHLDQDLTYDPQVKEWRPSSLTDTEHLHLPDQEELQEIWSTGTWHNEEVHRLEGGRTRERNRLQAQEYLYLESH